MKTIEVVAAIIHKDGKYFATQRGYGEFEGMWEFPGGKIEPGESHEKILLDVPPKVNVVIETGGSREWHTEELGIDISVKDLLCTTNYDYPSFHLIMHCYLCNIISGEIELKEHKAARWLKPEALNNVEWLPADKDIIEKLV